MILTLEILGVIIGIALTALGLFLGKHSAPDLNLAKVHLTDAAELHAEGDKEMAKRALLYADEAITGDDLMRRVSTVLIFGGSFLTSVSLLLIIST